MKKMNNTVFKVWKTRKIWKAFGKRRRKRSSKRFKNQMARVYCLKNELKRYIEMQIKALLL